MLRQVAAAQMDELDDSSSDVLAPVRSEAEGEHGACMVHQQLGCRAVGRPLATARMNAQAGSWWGVFWLMLRRAAVHTWATSPDRTRSDRPGPEARMLCTWATVRAMCWCPAELYLKLLEESRLARRKALQADQQQVQCVQQAHTALEQQQPEHARRAELEARQVGLFRALATRPCCPPGVPVSVFAGACQGMQTPCSLRVGVLACLL